MGIISLIEAIRLKERAGDFLTVSECRISRHAKDQLSRIFR